MQERTIFEPGQRVVCVAEYRVWGVPTLTLGEIYTITTAFDFGGQLGLTLAEVSPPFHPQVEFIGYLGTLFRPLIATDPCEQAAREIAA